MDYLQNTTDPTSQTTVVTQLLPMAAPLHPISIPKHASQISANIQPLEPHNMNPTSCTQQVRSTSAPADCMITSSPSSATSFLGTFASTPSFQTSVQQSQQQFSAFAGGRPRHHTTTNVLSLQSITSSQQSQDFIGSEVQRELNPFDGSSNC